MGDHGNDRRTSRRPGQRRRVADRPGAATPGRAVLVPTARSTNNAAPEPGDLLLAEIVDAFAADTPAAVFAAAEMAFELRNLDAHVAELVASTSTADLVGVRGGDDGTRRHRFRADLDQGQVVTVDITSEDGLVRGVADTALHSAAVIGADGRTHQLDTTASGFRGESLPGPITIEVRVDGGDTIRTEWLIL